MRAKPDGSPSPDGNLISPNFGESPIVPPFVNAGDGDAQMEYPELGMLGDLGSPQFG